MKKTDAGKSSGMKWDVPLLFIAVGIFFSCLTAFIVAPMNISLEDKFVWGTVWILIAMGLFSAALVTEWLRLYIERKQLRRAEGAMPEPDPERVTENLIEMLQALAAQPSVQAGLYPQGVCPLENLFEDAQCYIHSYLHHCELSSPDEYADALRQLLRAMERFDYSDFDCESMESDEVVFTRPNWSKVRELACETLRVMEVERSEPKIQSAIWYYPYLETAMAMSSENEAAIKTVVMYRPTGPEELVLVRESNFNRWPPRLPEQPIFYPVTNEKYAIEIASRWNVRESDVGYVTRFKVKKEFVDRYQVHQVGAGYHLEWWIPAEELEELNDNIVGLIEVIGEYRHDEST